MNPLRNSSADDDKVHVMGPYGAQDTLRNGIRSISHKLMGRHPLQCHLEKVLVLFEAIGSNSFKNINLTCSHGRLNSCTVINKQIVLELARESQRDCCLPSRNLLKEVETGAIESLEPLDLFREHYNDFYGPVAL